MLIIKIQNNKTGNKDVASYDYGIFVNKDRIAHGQIKNYKRRQGWKELAKLCIEDENMVDDELEFLVDVAIAMHDIENQNKNIPRKK